MPTDSPAEEPTRWLDADQAARGEALRLARKATGTATRGIGGLNQAPDTDELLRVAQWIMDGNTITESRE